jgi:hypothetical protein
LQEYALITDAGLLNSVISGFGGFFIRGDQNILHNIAGRPYIDVMSGIIVMSGIVFAVQRFMQPRYGLVVITTIMLLPVALFAPNSPNFMAFSVIVPLVAIFFALGIKQFYQLLATNKRHVFLLTYGTVALLVFNMGWTLFSLHVQWGTSEDVHRAYHHRIFRLATYLDHTVSCRLLFLRGTHQ